AYTLLFSACGHHRELHSFPTRRSSDLTTRRRTRRPPIPRIPPDPLPRRGSDDLGTRTQGHRTGEAARTRAVRLLGRGQVLDAGRSEEHTSELQSREISYAVFCLKKKNK